MGAHIDRSCQGGRLYFPFLVRQKKEEYVLDVSLGKSQNEIVLAHLFFFYVYTHREKCVEHERMSFSSLKYMVGEGYYKEPEVGAVSFRRW